MLHATSTVAVSDAGERHAGARRGQDRGIDDHDVGHRDERGHPADGLEPVRRRHCRYNPLRPLTTASKPLRADVVIVGAGAAGLATAIFCARLATGSHVVCVDGARSVGAKILVSGGTRCNVTNASVTERDFWGGDARVVRGVLRAFPADRAVALFEELGVPLHEEEDGKLFPDTNRARTVLEALVRELERLGGELHTSTRIIALERTDGRFTLETTAGVSYEADVVVLATGGRSLPKTGSDGTGYELARRLGHGYVETTPALVPLILNDSNHQRLAGVTHAAEIVLRVGGRIAIRLMGSMVWTHFGASGPLVLNASRHWLRARSTISAPEVALSLLPGETFESVDGWLRDQAQPTATGVGPWCPRVEASDGRRRRVARLGARGRHHADGASRARVETSPRAGADRNAARGEREPRL